MVHVVYTTQTDDKQTVWVPSNALEVIVAHYENPPLFGSPNRISLYVRVYVYVLLSHSDHDVNSFATWGAN